MGSTLRAVAVAAVSLSTTQLGVFQLDSSNALRHKSLSGSTWSSGWDNLGGTFSSIPSVTSWSSSNMECIGVGTDGGAWQRSWNGVGWGSWNPHGGTWNPKYPLCMVGYGGKYLDYFGVGTDGGCWHQYYNGNYWSGWDSLGGTFSTGLSVTVSASNRVDFYGVGTDGACWHRYKSGSSWSSWESRGGSFISEVVVISISINIQFIFGIQKDNSMYYSEWDGSNWSGWESLGGSFGSQPGVTAWGSGFSCMGTGTDGAMYYRSWSPSGGWDSGWESIGGNFNSAPTLVPYGSGFYCFGKQSDGIYSRNWDSSSWGTGWSGPL